jgi:hypothetical protein
MKVALILLFCLLGEPLIAKTPVTKRYNLSVCAIFKEEGRYLKEWIEYHRLVGVDHFYLYSNNSKDHFRRVLTPYIKEGVVTLIHWPDCLGEIGEKEMFQWALSTQASAYENAIWARGIKETKWLVFVDVNEFLVPSKQNNLAELLKKYEDYPAVTFSSTFFDASRVNVIPRRRLVIETLELTHGLNQNPQKAVTKTIFRPDQCKGFTWPPYECLFQSDVASLKLNREEVCINHYVNRQRDGFLPHSKAKDKLHVDHRILLEHETAALLQEGYEIEDQERFIARFIPPLLKKMGYDAGK